MHSPKRLRKGFIQRFFNHGHAAIWVQISCGLRLSLTRPSMMAGSWDSTSALQVAWRENLMKTKKVEVNTGKVKVKRRKMEVNMLAGSCDSTSTLQVDWMENMVKKSDCENRKSESEYHSRKLEHQGVASWKIW